ncbi:hypothetical protein [Streptomyces sp. NPDC020667]|uniref:hypothetical protein n=1 Tax=Streptomyces sp. NPDC020667 TaxID=3154895 RepID=UPI003408A45E
MLPITVNTESGEVRSGIGAEELGRLIGRLGADGDRFVVAERTADESGGDHYLQTWHEGAGPYEVEYREGSAERHFGVRMASAGRGRGRLRGVGARHGGLVGGLRLGAGRAG